MRRLWSGSIGSRLIMYFTLMALASVILAGGLIYTTSDARISKGTLRLSEQVVERYGESVDDVLTSMQTLAYLVRDDDQVQDILAMDRGTEELQRVAAVQLAVRLKQISRIRQEFNGIYVWLDDGTIGRSRYYSPLTTPRLTDAEYRAVRNRAREQWLFSEQGSIVVDNMGTPVLSLAISLTQKTTGLPCGIVVVEISRSTLNQSLNSGIGVNGTMFLLDPVQGVIMQGATADDHVVGSAAERVCQQAVGMVLETIELKDRLLICHRIASTGWIAVGVVFRSELRGDSLAILQVFIGTTLLSLLVAIILSQRITRYEMRPLQQIQAYIHVVEQGHFNRDIEPERPDEIGQLTESIHQMSRRLGSLVERQKEEQERIRVAELKALQAQINPHFLYNSLDSINWLARRGDVEKTTKMISALSAFFRIALSKGSDIIQLRDEVEHVHNYLRIQRIRYEQRFDYTIQVDPLLEGCLIPKLILQPLVENALYHGVKETNRRCLLSINAYKAGDNFEIDVIDNGAGMSRERLEQIRQALAHCSAEEDTGYGIVNVNDRIKIYAGQKYGLSFTSAEGMGTVAHVSLPMQVEKG